MCTDVFVMTIHHMIVDRTITWESYVPADISSGSSGGGGRGVAGMQSSLMCIFFFFFNFSAFRSFLCQALHAAGIVGERVTTHLSVSGLPLTRLLEYVAAGD